jgi:hypothetical protein
MNKAIKRGQAPRGITRIDTGKVKGEQAHAAFGDKSALTRMERENMVVLG